MVRTLSTYCRINCAIVLLWLSCSTLAAVTVEQASRLGGAELTPVGAERSGNAEGTIPSWTGGLEKLEASGSDANFLEDPFPDDQPLFSITAENMEHYADRLSEGQKALLRNHPDSWRMDVYPTRRSASYPEFVYDAIRSNATRAMVDLGGSGGVREAKISSPFPIPAQGVEVVWNHNLRWRGVAVNRYEGQASPTRGLGKYTLVVFEDQLAFPYGAPASEQVYGGKLPYVAIALKSKVIAPGKSAGRGQLVLESSNPNRMTRKTWQYNPSLRRVFRTPFSGFDNPAPLSEGLRFNDETDMYNGSPALFDWKLVGKRELYVPYNAYRLHDGSLEVGDILKSHHIDPRLSRYELHRVWVVEGTLKVGGGPDGRLRSRHSYSRRVLYVDEDSWSVLLADNYDDKGRLWRFSEGHLINYYQVPVPWYTLQTNYDFRQRRYLVSGLDNRFGPYEFTDTINPIEFSPNSLDYYVR